MRYCGVPSVLRQLVEQVLFVGGELLSETVNMVSLLCFQSFSRLIYHFLVPFFFEDLRS